MISAAHRLQMAEALGSPSRLDWPPSPPSGLRDLFNPLDELLIDGGDPRLALDGIIGVNAYGCGPAPLPGTLSFASSTASTISERAYERAGLAREELMRAAIATGLEDALEARQEEMREELKAHLRLSSEQADVVFSPSGTDAQLQALFLAGLALGPALTTIIVGSDQTGSGTVYTARGRHFSTETACRRPVCKDTPISGLSCDSIALPLSEQAGEIAVRPDIDAIVLEAIEAALAGGAGVLLQIMDCSKLGWRAPSEACLDEIVRCWPGRVQIVVDACQMRLGRPRMEAYLDRGYMVLLTGSKYFGGPAFSGALLVPPALSRLLDRDVTVAEGLLDYFGRSDWPARWSSLRDAFDPRINLGQWLRWEAALEEIRAYYSVPDAFRALALAELRAGIESLILLSPSLALVGPGASTMAGMDEEFADPTIFAFTLRKDQARLSEGDCRTVYRALAQDLSGVIAGSRGDREIAAHRCLVGQPVRIVKGDEAPAAVLRLCVGAPLVTESWSPEASVARENLQRQIDRIAAVVAKIELLLTPSENGKFLEFAYGV